ncbi:MAG TPA: peptidyl-prolyl cis-trans isomerase [Polyangiales bacterium]
MLRVGALSLLLISVVSRAHAESAVIAQGTGVRVTVADVEQALAQQSPRLRQRYRDPVALKGLVEELVRQQLLANEAQKRGYERDRAVRQNVKDSAAQGLVRAEVDAKVTPESIPFADVQAYYDAHPAEFHRPAMRRANVIVVDTADDARKLLPEAQKADARQFTELARQHSRDPQTKVQGGDLGYFTHEAVPEQPAIPDSVRAAAFALHEIGATSDVVPFAQQFAIVRMSGERPERNVTLESAAPSIRTKLWRERRQQALDGLVAELRKRAKPQVFTDRIYAIDFDDMERRPSGFAPDPVAPTASKDKP